ncbi:amidohydrolase family protein [Clostridium luticellarii]|jgi:predicted TIM-barrel fold metal-dependent hydrolase|uniref:Amidohydrolase n=1 Tax=Clostridium luticellarii TaxID=1691940 RepID=A0A2T0B4Q2_9CLOT|nr:amidohydrolase family protein [Clostridium luticellarii]MCI1946177.1 amidohydrolase [Clostridium luticellarii]MCI1969260.1 amidohydrolase [Clostridium luticellarii]MCI1996950.1 amidohydrolase [Clostridium luticellarii]MCI2040853.1 amidohydrolase [Clostridium luticellarii]PRR78870.1 Amidohydrolase [Clostridium luticellarii]
MKFKNTKRNLQVLLGSTKVSSVPKIDVHVHYLPKAYREALLSSGEEKPDGFPTPEWNVDKHLKVMKHLGIATTMLSISSPHVNFGDDEAARILARKVNEDGAEVVKKYSDKFGLLASLPLPNVKGSIEEIEYALDILNVDGFTLPTNTRGVYLGNPCLDPVFEELNKRKAVAVLHPNKPSSIPEGVNEGLPVPAMEFLFDTTRTVINMILKGTLKHYPDIKFVIPHAGAFLAILADRLDPFLERIPVGKEKVNVDVYAELKGLYYDVAGFCLPRQLENLLQIVDASHLLYGSDYPYTPEFGSFALVALLEKTKLLTDKERRAIYYDNALKLFPRLDSNLL